jgi:ATP-dependent helicase HepA
MEGLNLFAQNRNGVHYIYKQFEPALETLFAPLKQGRPMDEQAFTRILSETRHFCEQVDTRLAKGKNILLEMNSFKPAVADQILDHIDKIETRHPVADLFVQILHHYGIETDFFDPPLFRLNFDTLADENFPEPRQLTDVMTFDRKTAVIRDDLAFFSWDHPFVQQTFDYFITHNTGACATALLTQHKGQAILLETLFIVECLAPARLNLDRYLIPEPIRIVVDHTGMDVTSQYDPAFLSDTLTQDHSAWFKDMEQVRNTLIPAMMEKSRKLAETVSRQMIDRANERIRAILGDEIQRLVALKKINPDIREQEICLAREKMADLLSHISQSRIRMDALRLIRVI